MKKLLLILVLMCMIVFPVFSQTGDYTTHNLFYLPGYGASGVDEYNEYNTYQEIADAQIWANKIAITTKQPLDAGLTSIAGLTTAANKMIYTTALDTYAVCDLSAFGRSIIDDVNEATFKATVNLEIGTDVLAQQTIGIADNNLVEIDDADAAINDYCKLIANGIVGRSYSEVKTDLDIDLTLYYLKTEMDSFSELQVIISDKTLINEEDAITLDNDLNMGTHKIVGVVDPTTDQEAATKKYVDDVVTLPPKIHSAVGSSNISTGSTSYVDMTNMSITATFPAGKVLISFCNSIRLNAIHIYCAIVVDDNVKTSNEIHLPNDGTLVVTTQWVETLSAGEHTIKIQWKVSAGTAYQDGATCKRVLTILECR